MGTGFLTVQVRTGDDALPVAGAHVTLLDTKGRTLFEAYTDENGNTGLLPLEAPDAGYTLNPGVNEPTMSHWDVDVEKSGYVTAHIHGVEVVDTQTSILPVSMLPIADELSPMTEEDINIEPSGLVLPDSPGQPDPPPSQIFKQVLIPEYITVHLGTPGNAAARNVRVKFPDYIKNVVSSEIYPTWPESSLIANTHAIVTFALNRIYTEWYRSRGFNFDITNSTSYDQYYRDGAQVFENISRIVDNIFNVYVHRQGLRNPFFTSFCNGTTATCEGLSQWGTVSLANQGMTPLEILRHYYPNDITLSSSDNIGGITESFPGYALRQGSQGEPVRKMQVYLNRIRGNFPLIPPISNPNGAFGPDTAEAVRAFQQSFSLNPDSVIGRATWNKIVFTYVGVTRLAELDSEGERESIGDNPPSVVLYQGTRGGDVRELQFIINSIAPFYDTIPTLAQDAVFGPSVKNAVIEFQNTFGLMPDGVVGPTTWDKLYAVYRGIYENLPIPPNPPTDGAPAYPGTPLTLGSTGAAVRTMQAYLNTIRVIYTDIPYIVVDSVFGEATRGAVVAFQNAFMLAPDGVIGPVTWDYIVKQYDLLTGGASVSLEFPGQPLRRGSAGSSVRLMQGFLNELKSRYPSLPNISVDGLFGSETQAAVAGFQRLFGLTPSGEIDSDTWYEIIRRRNAVV